MIRKTAHRVNGAVVVGLVILALATASPVKHTGKGNPLRDLDFISDALWAGCKAQAAKRIAAALR